LIVDAGAVTIAIVTAIFTAIATAFVTDIPIAIATATATSAAKSRSFVDKSAYLLLAFLLLYSILLPSSLHLLYFFFPSFNFTVLPLFYTISRI
jgi:hypothetical protein